MRLIREVGGSELGRQAVEITLEVLLDIINDPRNFQKVNMPTSAANALKPNEVKEEKKEKDKK